MIQQPNLPTIPETNNIVGRRQREPMIIPNVPTQRTPDQMFPDHNNDHRRTTPRHRPRPKTRLRQFPANTMQMRQPSQEQNVNMNNGNPVRDLPQGDRNNLRDDIPLIRYSPDEMVHNSTQREYIPQFHDLRSASPK